MADQASPVDTLRIEANAHHKAQRYDEAVQLYTEAINLAGEEYSNLHVLFSNRAASYNGMQQPEKALADAERAIALAPNYVKGYHRHITALLELGRLAEALATCVQGIRQCPVESPDIVHDLEAHYSKTMTSCFQQMADKGMQVLREHRTLGGLMALSPMNNEVVPAPETFNDPQEVGDDVAGALNDGEADTSEGIKRQLSDAPVSGESAPKKTRKGSLSARWGSLGRDWATAKTTTHGLCTCGHCGRLLFQPCTLSCGHSICHACLTELEQSWPAQSRRCPSCHELLRTPEFKRGLCRQVRDLVAAVFEKEAHVVEMVHSKKELTDEEFTNLLSSGLPDDAAALLHVWQAEQLLPTSPEEALKHVAMAQQLDSRLHQSYMVEYDAHLAEGRPADAMKALARGYTCSRPVQACEGPAGFLQKACQLLTDSSTTQEHVDGCLSVWQMDITCDPANEKALQLPSACPQLKHRLNRSLCLSKLECPICLNIFCDPITVHCGHTFCRVCLSRTLDHDNHCPFCRAVMPTYLSHQHKTNSVLQAIIELHFQTELEERQEQLKQEQAMDNMDEFPIFVCMVALPGSNYPLHIFEPRYRLMIRRAWETTKRIGMCVHTYDGFASVGCVLELSDLNMLPDGRCTLQTYGTRRFRVLERSMKDGYNVGKIEWYDDDVEQEARLDADGKTSSVINQVKQFITQQCSASLLRRAAAHFGDIPANDESLRGFWYARLLSNDNQEFLQQFLELQTNRERYDALSNLLQLE